MVVGKHCTGICQAIKNSVIVSGGAYKLIFGEAMILTVNSGGA